MTTPSQVNVSPIEVRRSVRTETLDLRNADKGRAKIISEAYKRSGGKGPLAIVVSYDGHHQDQAVHVRRQGRAFRAHLLDSGVPVVDLDFVPVSDRTKADKAVLTWSAMTAAPPAHCGRVPGHAGASTLKYAREYKFGCETQSALSRQIADPSDLLGRSGLPEDEASRAGALVDDYRSGVPNETDQAGTTASDTAADGGGG